MLISKFLHLSDLILTVLPQVGNAVERFNKEDEGSKGSHGALPGPQSKFHTTILTRYSYSKKREDDLRSGLNSELCKVKKKKRNMTGLTVLCEKWFRIKLFNEQKRTKFLKHNSQFHYSGL